MPEIQLPAIRLYYEERGAGAPILGIHGTGSSAWSWAAAAADLARFGRVITYDRRGCTRSERPVPYGHTTPAEHAEDAAALLEALGATPAIVVGRSYGGDVALYLALRYPEHVRAIVLLEGGGDSLSETLSPAMSDYLAMLADQILTAVAERGPAAAGEALLRGVLGDTDYAALPDEMKARAAANGPAIVAEVTGYKDGQLDPRRLSEVTCPALVVAARSSPPAFRALSERLAADLTNARLAIVEGGHLIDPADPQVLRFIQEILASP